MVRISFNSYTGVYLQTQVLGSGKEELKHVKRTREIVAAQKKDEDKPYIPGGTIRGSFRRTHQVERRYPARQKLIRAAVIISLIIIMIMAVYFTQAFSYFFKFF